MMKIDDSKAKEVNVALTRYFKSLGMSQAEIANRLGCATSTVGNTLSYGRFGKRMAAKWAGEFGLNERFLLTGQGKLVERQSGYQKLVRENQTLKAIIRAQKSMLASR